MTKLSFGSVFKYENGELYWKIAPSTKIKIGNRAGSKTKSFSYYTVRFKGKDYLIHRVIWEIHFGPIESEYEIDHINRNKLDNRIENLRKVNISINRSNTERTRRRKFPVGVSKSGRGYKAVICYNYKYYHLGTFDSVEEAKEARRIKYESFYGV